eukprot:2193809-Prymnesium_polylepis.1
MPRAAPSMLRTSRLSRLAASASGLASPQQWAQCKRSPRVNWSSCGRRLNSWSTARSPGDRA